MRAAAQKNIGLLKRTGIRGGPVGTMSEEDLVVLGLSDKSTAVHQTTVAKHGQARAVNVTSGLAANLKTVKANLVKERHGELIQGQQALSQQLQESIKVLQNQAMANLTFLRDNLANFKADVQASILQLNTNLVTVQTNIFNSMREMETANGARHEQLKHELNTLKTQLGAINTELDGIKVELGDVKTRLEGLARAAQTIQAQVDAQAASSAAANQAVAAAVAAAQEEVAALAAAQASAQAQNAARQRVAAGADDLPTVEVYSCNCCGGNVIS